LPLNLNTQKRPLDHIRWFRISINILKTGVCYNETDEQYIIISKVHVQ
jgi:hypothetical protein